MPFWPNDSFHPSNFLVTLISLTILLIMTKGFVEYRCWPRKNCKVQSGWFWTLYSGYSSWLLSRGLICCSILNRHENGAMEQKILFCQACKLVGQSDIWWSSQTYILISSRHTSGIWKQEILKHAQVPSQDNLFPRWNCSVAGAI